VSFLRFGLVLFFAAAAAAAACVQIAHIESIYIFLSSSTEYILVEPKQNKRQFTSTTTTNHCSILRVIRKKRREATWFSFMYKNHLDHE
jgi:hypothetical protein